jgi:hypothetical protein
VQHNRHPGCLPDFACLPGIRTLFSGGHFAVSVFFVLSGYVLSMRPARKHFPLRHRGPKVGDVPSRLVEPQSLAIHLGNGYDGKYYFACLPGIRTLFSGGHFAVSVFFVLSGYIDETIGGIRRRKGIYLVQHNRHPGCLPVASLKEGLRLRR